MSQFFRSITKFFTGSDGSSSARRDTAMSSTDDAFSIPYHSPTLTSHSLFPNTSNPDSAGYSYPPAQSPGTYAFGASPSPYPPVRHEDMDSQDAPPNSRAGDSILPMHRAGASYQSLQQTWTRIESWLSRHFPELGDTFNYGILPEDLHEIQRQFGFPLPQTIRDSYLRVDGQEAESSAGCSEGLFFGLTLLSLEEVFEEWKFWREVDDDPATGANPKLKERMKSIPSGYVQCDYSNRGWIPLATDRVGNYIGVDLNPAEKGRPGQVIIFGRDFDTKVVLWRGDGEGGWAKWLAAFAEELEASETFDNTNGESNSEGSEDSIGHEPYFFDGSANGNRGQGGGDGGALGLRLNGEYTRWNTLEALADRSVKKWKEAGVVSDEEYPPPAPKVISGLVGLPALPHDTGVEVAIPLIDDEPSVTPDKSEPETPRAPAHTRSKTSVSRPVPQPIDLPTRSDIAIDVASGVNEPEMTQGDLERGDRMPLRDLQSRSKRPDGVSPDGATFSPRMSEEDTRLLKRISVEPPTPVTTNAEGELVTLPHKRRSPSPTEDLLNDDPPQALPMTTLPSKTDDSKPDGSPKVEAISSTSGSEAAGTTNGSAVTAEISA